VRIEYVFLIAMVFSISLVYAQDAQEIPSYTCSFLKDGTMEQSIDTPLCIVHEGQLQITGMDTSQYTVFPVANYPQHGLNQQTFFFTGVGEIILNDGIQTLRVDVFSPEDIQFKIKTGKELESAYLRITALEFSLNEANNKIIGLEKDMLYLRDKNYNLTQALADEGRYVPYYVISNQSDYERWMGDRKGFWDTYGDFIYGGGMMLTFIYGFYWYRARSEQSMV
tara:strand:+ start:313 stop:984 length:672 start_codon:yes stop_codon:yes gene_type:complete